MIYLSNYMNKNFSIFKTKEKKNENSPDYSISMKIGDKYVTVGAGWIKESKSGKYISCKLSDSYKDIKGFEIVQEKGLSQDEIEKLKKAKEANEMKFDINPDNIPF